MRLGRSFIALFLLVVLAGSYSELSRAEDYYWGSEHKAPSALSACQAELSKLRAGSSSRYTFSLYGFVIISETIVDCTFTQFDNAFNPPSESKLYARFGRYGDGCTPPKTYNSETGGCENPSPECPVGDMFPAKGSDSPVISSGGRNYVVDGGPPSVCYNQCTYNGGDFTPASSCYFVTGSKDTGFCNYVLKSTGGSCGADSYELSKSGDPLNSPDTPDVPPSDPDDPGCSDVPGYVWSGTTCVKDPGDSDGPGDGSDGDGSGDGNGNGDGDGDGNSDGGGSGNGDGSGDGNGDGSDGDGNGSGEGNGDGEGEGQCDPATDPNKCAQPSVGGESCDAELKCEGDVIQCAILRKNKEQLCQWTYDAAVKKQIADEMAGEEYQLKEESIPVAGLFSEAVNKGRWLPQSCPPPENFTVMGRSYSFSWEPACRFAQAIGPLIVALASIFFAVSIGRGIKGS